MAASLGNMSPQKWKREDGSSDTMKFKAMGWCRQNQAKGYYMKLVY